MKKVCYNTCMENEVLIKELEELTQTCEDLLDEVSEVASEYALEEVDLKKLEETKIYKFLNEEYNSLLNESCEAEENFNFNNAFNLFKLYKEKSDFIRSDLNMSVAFGADNLDEELFNYNYTKLAFMLKELELMIDKSEAIIDKLKKK